MSKWLAVVILLFAASCTDNTKVPKEFIQKDKMQKILWDMMQADRFVTDFLPKPGDSTYNEKEILKVYQKVFNLHGITRDDFLKSYTFYLNHPDITKVLYDSISVQAERRRKEVYESKKDTVKKDTLGQHSLKRPLVPDSARKHVLDSIKNRIRKPITNR
jgi:hypothetical protein